MGTSRTKRGQRASVGEGVVSRPERHEEHDEEDDEVAYEQSACSEKEKPGKGERAGVAGAPSQPLHSAKSKAGASEAIGFFHTLLIVVASWATTAIAAVYYGIWVLLGVATSVACDDLVDPATDCPDLISLVTANATPAVVQWGNDCVSWTQVERFALASATTVPLDLSLEVIKDGLQDETLWTTMGGEFRGCYSREEQIFYIVLHLVWPIMLFFILISGVSSHEEKEAELAKSIFDVIFNNDTDAPKGLIDRLMGYLKQSKQLISEEDRKSARERDEDVKRLTKTRKHKKEEVKDAKRTKEVVKKAAKKVGEWDTKVRERQDADGALEETKSALEGAKSALQVAQNREQRSALDIAAKDTVVKQATAAMDAAKEKAAAAEEKAAAAEEKAAAAEKKARNEMKEARKAMKKAQLIVDEKVSTYLDGDDSSATKSIVDEWQRKVKEKEDNASQQLSEISKEYGEVVEEMYRAARVLHTYLFMRLGRTDGENDYDRNEVESFKAKLEPVLRGWRRSAWFFWLVSIFSMSVSMVSFMLPAFAALSGESVASDSQLLPACTRLSDVVDASGAAQVSFGGRCVPTQRVTAWLEVIEDALSFQDAIADVVELSSNLGEVDLAGHRRFLVQTSFCSQRTTQAPRQFFIKVASVLVAAPTWLGFWMFSVAKGRWAKLKQLWESLPEKTRSFLESLFRKLPKLEPPPPGFSIVEPVGRFTDRGERWLISKLVVTWRFFSGLAVRSRLSTRHGAHVEPGSPSSRFSGARRTSLSRPTSPRCSFRLSTRLSDALAVLLAAVIIGLLLPPGIASALVLLLLALPFIVLVASAVVLWWSGRALLLFLRNTRLLFWRWTTTTLRHVQVAFLRRSGLPLCPECKLKDKYMLFCWTHFCRTHQFYFGSSEGGCPGCQDEDQLCQHTVRSWGSWRRVPRVRKTCTICFCQEHGRETEDLGSIAKTSCQRWRRMAGKCEVCLDPCPIHEDVARTKCDFCWCSNGHSRARECQDCGKPHCMDHRSKPRMCSLCKSPCPNHPDIIMEECTLCWCQLHNRAKKIFWDGGSQIQRCLQCEDPCEECQHELAPVGPRAQKQDKPSGKNARRRCCWPRCCRPKVKDRDGAMVVAVNDSDLELQAYQEDDFLYEDHDDGESWRANVPATEECPKHLCLPPPLGDRPGHMKKLPCPVCKDPCRYQDGHRDEEPRNRPARTECLEHWCPTHERECPEGGGTCLVCKSGCDHFEHDSDDERHRPTRDECQVHWCSGNRDRNDRPHHQLELVQNNWCPVCQDPCTKCEAPDLQPRLECRQHWCQPHNRARPCGACDDPCPHDQDHDERPVPGRLECPQHWCARHDRPAANGRDDGQCLLCIDPCVHHTTTPRENCTDCFCREHERNLCQSESSIEACARGFCPECNCVNCNAVLASPGIETLEGWRCSACINWCPHRRDLEMCELCFCNEHKVKRDLEGSCPRCRSCAHGVDPLEKCPRCYCQFHRLEIKEHQVVCVKCFLPEMPLPKRRFCKLVARFINWHHRMGLLPVHLDTNFANEDGRPRNATHEFLEDFEINGRGSPERGQPLLDWQTVWNTVVFKHFKHPQSGLDMAMISAYRRENRSFSLVAMWGTAYYIWWFLRNTRPGLYHRLGTFLKGGPLEECFNEDHREVANMSLSKTQVWVVKGVATELIRADQPPRPAGIPTPQEVIEELAGGGEFVDNFSSDYFSLNVNIGEQDTIFRPLLPSKLLFRKRELVPDAQEFAYEPWEIRCERTDDVETEHNLNHWHDGSNCDRCHVLDAADKEQYRDIIEKLRPGSQCDFSSDCDSDRQGSETERFRIELFHMHLLVSEIAQAIDQRDRDIANHLIVNQPISADDSE